MKSITIKGSKRESVGKKATKALRNAGQVPCVIYGGDKPMSFSAEENAFRSLVYTPNAHTVVIELEDGSKVKAILQDIQFHPVTDRILHVDFYEIFDDKDVTMEVPVNTVGNSVGVRNGGVLRVVTRRLRVKALPANLPDMIEVDITKMIVGDQVNVGDIEAEGFTIMHPEDEVICQVRTSRTAISEIEEEEAEAEAAEAAEGEEAEEGEEGETPTEE